MAHCTRASHVLVRLCLIAFALGSYGSLAKQLRCQPLQLLHDYESFAVEVAGLPADEASTALIKGSWLTFESKVAEDASRDDASARERLEFTLNTVGLLLSDAKYDGSTLKAHFGSLVESSAACSQVDLAVGLSAQSLLTVRVSKEGYASIDKEVKEVREMADNEYHRANPLLLNIALRLNRFRGTQHYRDIEGKVQEVRGLEDAKASARELKQVLEGLKHKVQKGDRWASIENKDLQEILNHVQKINDLTKSIKRTPEYSEMRAEIDRAMQTHEMQVVKRRYHRFVKSAYAKKWGKELRDVAQTFEKEMRLEDVPFDLQLPETKDIKQEIPDISSDDE